MFTRDTRMSEVLARRPELRTILPAFHPEFARLSHPVLGRVLPRLVTVADAARIAGVDEATLLEVLHLPGPPDPNPSRERGAHSLPAASVSPPVAEGSGPPPAWLREPVVLDARPLLARGEDPFATIMAALRELPPGRPLTVIAPFEPAPLIRLLGKRGAQSWVEVREGAVYTSFWFAAAPAEGEAAPAARLVRGPEGATLDVRGLEPPHPMNQVLAALDDTANLPLRVLHHREPSLLYPRLGERGLRWEVTHGEGVVEILIRAGA